VVNCSAFSDRCWLTDDHRLRLIVQLRTFAGGCLRLAIKLLHCLQHTAMERSRALLQCCSPHLSNLVPVTSLRIILEHIILLKIIKVFVFVFVVIVIIALLLATPAHPAAYTPRLMHTDSALDMACRGWPRDWSPRSLSSS